MITGVRAPYEPVVRTSLGESPNRNPGSSPVRRLRRAAGLALAALLALPAVTAATATTAAADPGSGGRLTWNACQDGFQCATLEVPMDYTNALGAAVDLAVIKLPATDKTRRVGTLFVNFGGPGASGLQRMRERGRWPWLFSAELRARFDVVSWDPRGIGASTAVRCFDTLAEQQAYLGSMPELPGDPSGEPAFFAASRDLAERCGEEAGDLLEHVSSANTARDLDRLRQALGEDKLTYHGISYGTQLGAIYANLFPDRVRAMVFDGSMDFVGNVTGHGDQGTTVPLDTRQGVSDAIAETFDEFLRLCAEAGDACAFGGGDPRAKWEAVMARAERGPITVQGEDGPQTWTRSAIFTTAGDLSALSGWPDIAALLQSLHEAVRAEAMSAEPAATRAATATAAPRELYTSNRTEAFNAIQCVDSDFPTDESVYRAHAASEDRRVPHFGRIGVLDMMSCAYWPARDANRYTGPWNRWTSAEILVINNRYDPATPLAGARAGAAQLARARVFVTEGHGHSTMLSPSTCTERVKLDYLVSGAFPAAGTRCGNDAPNPFTS